MAASEKVVDLNLIVTRGGIPVADQAQGLRDFKAACRPALTPPAKEDRLKCQCGNEHFMVTRVDFTCTVCFKSYRD